MGGGGLLDKINPPRRYDCRASDLLVRVDYPQGVPFASIVHDKRNTVKRTPRPQKHADCMKLA